MILASSSPGTARLSCPASQVAHFLRILRSILLLLVARSPRLVEYRASCRGSFVRSQEKGLIIMSNRNQRMASAGVLNARAAINNPGMGLMRPNPAQYAQQGRPQMVPPPLMSGPPGPIILEQKLSQQHNEIQRLLTENQRLAATHVALRQELAAAQQEIQRMQAMMQGIQAEKEVQFRSLMEKSAKLEADLRATEPLKSEVHQARTDCQKLHLHTQELGQQVRTLTQELQRVRADAQVVPTLRTENESLRAEVQRARTAFEYEKKANAEQLQQRQGMEKNLVTMAREVEKLRAELTNSEKRQRLNPPAVSQYNGTYAAPEVAYNTIQQPGYTDNYAMHAAHTAHTAHPAQMPIATENGVQQQYPSAPAQTWASYDMQRHVSNPHVTAY